MLRHFGTTNGSLTKLLMPLCTPNPVRFTSIYRFVNPYTKPLLVSGMATDGRAFNRKRVPARSAARIDLSELLFEGEESAYTRLQITATNRVLTYHVRHDGSTVPYISDHEHLDIYRADPTHTPFTFFVREKLARWVKRRHFVAT